VQQAFVEFVQLIPPHGLIIGCGDEPGVRAVLKQATAPVITYGLAADNDWQAVERQPNQRGGYDFTVLSPTQTLSEPVSLAVPGLHNVANALAALIASHHQGVDLRQAATILSHFQGVGRRFELKGEVGGITVIDDYAHHPTEIRATLAAARARFGDRPLWVMAQPHTFSRTLALLDEFTTAFAEADHVLIVDIFPSREQDEGLVHSRDIVARMRHSEARYIGPLREAAAYLLAHLHPGDVLLTFGAGDGYLVGEWVVAGLAGD
jgi:UDP-N-acetylmuramate--alanine ligase